VVLEDHDAPQLVGGALGGGRRCRQEGERREDEREEDPHGKSDGSSFAVGFDLAFGALFGRSASAV
jgi:hypothetical protein